MFCGAGGSSQGIRRIATKNNGGIEVRLAMNHWKLAIKTHQTNFPDTDHDCADISASEPRRYDSTDILIASPECTNHSLAKNKKRIKKQLNIFETQQEAEDRSRATMWDVPRFAECHKYNCIITENVVDAKRWVMYDAWIYAMQKLGYDYKECYFNSMHFHPTPQSRDRLYVVFWKKGNKAPQLDYHPLAYCEKCCKDVFAIQIWKANCLDYGKYRTQYIYQCSCGNIVEPYYYAAFNCINFLHKSERIGDRKTPLKPNTLRRVQIGIDKYWNNPFVIYGGDKKEKNHADRTYSLYKAIPTQCAQPWHSLISPFINYTDQTGSNQLRIHEGSVSMKTQTTTQNSGICMPPLPFIAGSGYNKLSSSGKEMYTQSTHQNFGLVQSPFIINARHTKHSDSYIKNANEPVGTQATQISHGIIEPPFLVQNNGQSTVNDMRKAIPTMVGATKHAIVTNEAYQMFIGHYYKGAHEKHITEPIGACTSKDRHYAITLKADEKIKVEDCFYRMIRSDEVGSAMAFDETYIVLGDERQKVRQYGNAVTPPVMEWLAERCVDSLR